MSTDEASDPQIATLSGERPTADDLRAEFLTLAAQWREETAGYSITTPEIAHPAYLRIIGMGERSLPWIFEQLAEHGDQWYVALHAITGLDPVPEEDRGRRSKMRDAWLGWARDNGWIEQLPSCLGDIELFLPGLELADHRITSDADRAYNCIAWALGETDRWWSPSPQSRDYWPKQLPRRDTVENVAAAFALAGFEQCNEPGLEPGVEKIALFADEGRFTHVTRQLASGRWTSKIGKNCDIEHDLGALTSRRSSFPSYRYDRIVGFMSRSRHGAAD